MLHHEVLWYLGPRFANTLVVYRGGNGAHSISSLGRKYSTNTQKGAVDGTLRTRT